MSDKSGQNDPSMNEILGSIRRIINEDNAQTGADAMAPGSEEEEILDLTEEVTAEEAGAPRLAPAFGAAAAQTGKREIRREPLLGLHKPARPAADAVTEHSDAAVEQPVATAQEFDEPVQQDMTAAPDESMPIPSSPEMTQETGTPPGDAPQPVDPAPPVQPAPMVSEEAVHEIITGSATTATATALGELTRAMDEKTNKLKLGPGGESISDIVKEMIRPMLREWLDENLPVIVERIVRREIQKLVDHAEPDD